MRLLLLVLLPATLQAQSFATLEAHIAATKGNFHPGWGVTFSGGGYLKNKTSRTFQLGAGITVNGYTYDNIFAVPFAQFGYFNPVKKISPYINGRIGYAILKDATFAEVQANKGGVYLSVRAGCGFKISKIARVTPFGAVEVYNLRYVVNRETIKSSSAGILCGGIAFLFGR